MIKYFIVSYLLWTEVPRNCGCSPCAMYCFDYRSERKTIFFSNSDSLDSFKVKIRNIFPDPQLSIDTVK